MSLHDRIMNIRIDEEELRRELPKASFAAYKIGHRDARHEAAEICLYADGLIDAVDEFLRIENLAIQGSSMHNKAKIMLMDILSKAKGESK